MKSKKLACMSMVLLVSACANKPASEPDRVVQHMSSEQPIAALGTDELLSHIGILPPQKLDIGECGLFLWLKREDAPLVFFQRSDGQAFMAVDGSMKPMERTETEQPIALQYFKNQSFEVGDMVIQISVKPESLRSLKQGLKLPDGSISIQQQGGWSAILPVAGLIACK